MDQVDHFRLSLVCGLAERLGIDIGGSGIKGAVVDLADEYGYDSHSAREALNYVTTLLAQE